MSNVSFIRRNLVPPADLKFEYHIISSTVILPQSHTVSHQKNASVQFRYDFCLLSYGSVQFALVITAFISIDCIINNRICFRYGQYSVIRYLGNAFEKRVAFVTDFKILSIVLSPMLPYNAGKGEKQPFPNS